MMTSGHDSVLEIFRVIPLNKHFHENDCIVYIKSKAIPLTGREGP
jgi:hypothetical protein